MRFLVSAITSSFLAALFLLSQASSAEAQLQWQANGAPESQVQPASYSETLAKQKVKKKKPRVAKAPTIPMKRHTSTRTASAKQVKQATARPKPQAAEKPSLKNNTVAKRIAAAAAKVDPASHVIYDGPVSPACYDGCCDAPACGCPVDCGTEVSCGLSLGNPCECGSVGCAGECGVPCDCGEVCGCGDACGCGDTCCGGDCGYDGLGGCRTRGGVPLVLFLPPVQEFTIFGGVHGFKNPLDGPSRDSGNFGFHEGFNLGGRMAWIPLPDLGYQVGYQAVHSQLQGDGDAMDSDSHTQQFLTAGLFRRRPVGFQYGLVYDWLRDERLNSDDYSQLRGLIGITNPCGHEVGFLFTSALTDNDYEGVEYQAANQYLIYYRMNHCNGGEFSIFGGGTEEGDGLLGANIEAPLNSRVTFQGGFTYLVAEEDVQGAGGREEAWNVGMNIVWHYGKRAKCCYKAPFRPLFNVADNGSLIVTGSQFDN